MPVDSRKDHIYLVPERVTPLEEIPEKYRQKTPLPGGKSQITDIRLCYNWEPGKDGETGRLVECSSVAADAAKQGFFPPQD